jgi:hypothetical protein
MHERTSNTTGNDRVVQCDTSGVSATSGTRRRMASLNGTRTIAARIELYDQRVTAYLAAYARGLRDQLHHVQMRAGLNQILNEIRRRSSDLDKDGLEANTQRILERLDIAITIPTPARERRNKSQAADGGQNSELSTKVSRQSETNGRSSTKERLGNDGFPSTSVRTVRGGLPSLGKRS